MKNTLAILFSLILTGSALAADILSDGVKQVDATTLGGVVGGTIVPFDQGTNGPTEIPDFSEVTNLIQNIAGPSDAMITNAFVQLFILADLGGSDNITFIHSFGETGTLVQIYNNTNFLVLPDQVEHTDLNNTKVSLGSFTNTMSGTWTFIAFGSGSPASVSPVTMRDSFGGNDPIPTNAGPFRLIWSSLLPQDVILDDYTHDTQSGFVGHSFVTRKAGNDENDFVVRGDFNSVAAIQTNSSMSGQVVTNGHYMGFVSTNVGAATTNWLPSIEFHWIP